VYKYSMGSNEAAQGAFDEMVQGSPGRWVWNNLRNHVKGDPTHNPDGSKIASKYGKVFGNPSKETIGGIGASNVPYDKSSYNRVKRFMNEMPGFEELAKKMSKFKMEVKAEGDGATSGEPFSQEELGKFQDKMKKEVEVRKSMLDEIRASLKGKGGLKDAKRVAEQLPDLDFTVNDIDLYTYLTEGGKHKIEEIWYEGEYRGYKVIDKLGNVLREKVFSKEELKVKKSGKGRGWHGDPEGHSSAAKKGTKQDITEDTDGGRWITVNGSGEGTGVHVFVNKGQTVGEALDEFFTKKQAKKRTKELSGEFKRIKKEGKALKKEDRKREKAKRKRDLMEEIYDLEVQLINQGQDIEQIREEYEQWEN